MLGVLWLLPGIANACPSLQNVKAFKGHVTEHVGAVASGDYPQNQGGGTQTIQLGRVVQRADIHLGDEYHKDRFFDFKGGISGGQTVIDDVYQDTGLDYYGELKYSGPVKKHSGNHGVLFVSRQDCKYNLASSFVISAAYQGDHQVFPGIGATMGFFGKVHSIPNDLKLDGDADVLPRPDLPNDVRGDRNYATLGSGWMPDLIILFECNSPLATGGCLNDENPEFKTPAHFSWHLHPVFEK